MLPPNFSPSATAGSQRSGAAAPVEAPTAVELAQCEQEPIHIPGAIQPRGVLVALSEPDLRVTQASRNAHEVFGAALRPVVGRPLAELLTDQEHQTLREALQRDLLEANPLYMLTIQPPQVNQAFDLVVHRNHGVLIAEFFPVSATAGDHSGRFLNLHNLVQTALANLEQARTLADLWETVPTEIRRLTGFDRVMVYRFDPQWNGEVVGEARADDLDSWVGLRYPSSDIPAQARAMYALSRWRLVEDVCYVPVPVEPSTNPTTRRPLDLTHASLRSVSPIHLEYLKNMGVGASMSFSIIRNSQLWGMILCHHRTPRRVSYETRSACQMITQMLAMQLSSKEETQFFDQTVRLKSMQPRLLRYMAEGPDYTHGLAQHADEVLDFAGAAGFALAEPERIRLFGSTPTADQVAALVKWLSESAMPAAAESESPATPDHSPGKASPAGAEDEQAPRQDVFFTDHLAGQFGPAASFVEKASGLLAISISRTHNSYVLWFRPEVFRSVRWAGDPQKPVQFNVGAQVVRPRSNFEEWKQTLRQHATPWEEYVVAAAAELRNAIVGIVLRQAEERAQLVAELQQSNRELEAFSYSVSHDLRAPFRHIVGFSDLLQKRNAHLDETSRRYLRTISESASFAGTLVDSLLSFSQMGRLALRKTQVRLDELVAEVQRDLSLPNSGRKIEWMVGPLPTVEGDLTMLRLALQNLLDNAIKYTRPRELAVIEVGMAPERERNSAAQELVVLYVRDNGVGFDMQYKDKLFGVFQRLHRMEEFEGTGIGLANVRRIVERHGGRVWATSAPGQGATFFFTLPEPGQALEDDAPADRRGWGTRGRKSN